MNKREAKHKAYSEDLSIGQLRQMVSEARGRGGASKVNPAFALEETLDMYDAGMNGRQDDEVPRQRNMGILMGDVMLITNILRETVQLSRENTSRRQG